MLPGVYLTMTGTPTQEQREIAALLYAGSGSVITGAVAVRRHHLTCAGLNLIDVLIPADEQRASTGFVRIQRTTRMPDKVHKTGAIRFAPPHRAVADAARKMTSFGDVQAVVCASLQRKRCALPLLIEELNEGPSAESRSLRRALAEVSDGVRSTAEADLKKLIDHSDLEKPLYNARLYTPDGDFIAKPDAWWQRAGVAGEVDSREYHMEAADYRATQMRHNRMESYGINVQHWLPSVIAIESRTVLPTSAGRSPQDTRGRSCPSSRWSTANTTDREHRNVANVTPTTLFGRRCHIDHIRWPVAGGCTREGGRPHRGIAFVKAILLAVRRI